MEKIRELVALLQAGIEEYDDQLKLLQKERLKFLRLSITDEFVVEEGDSSKDSWILHLAQLENSLGLRLDALRRAIKDSAASIDF